MASKTTKAKPKPRLRPGQLDGLVLGYMKAQGRAADHGDEGRAGIKRSSGAVGNCLGRLEKEKKVRLAGKKPRRYDLAGSTE
jgi:hypothetical protein